MFHFFLEAEALTEASLLLCYASEKRKFKEFKKKKNPNKTTTKAKNQTFHGARMKSLK